MSLLGNAPMLVAILRVVCSSHIWCSQPVASQSAVFGLPQVSHFPFTMTSLMDDGAALAP